MSQVTLKELRNRFDLNQRDVAKLVGVNQSTYNAWETLTTEDIKKLAVIFKCDPRDIEVPKRLRSINTNAG